MQSFDNMFNDMDEIVDNIWLGNYIAAKDKDLLKKQGIKKVLTVMDDYGPIYENNEFIHKKFLVDDINLQNIIQYFGECLNFIKGEEKILVHCMAGASRSATIVIAYLMWAKKMKFDEALKLTMSKRSIVYPNFGFLDQLKKFEKLLIDNEYDIDKINFKEIKWKLDE